MSIATCIVILIVSFLMVPAEKYIYKRISNKIFAYVATALVASALMLGLFGIASLLGFSILK